MIEIPWPPLETRPTVPSNTVRVVGSTIPDDLGGRPTRHLSDEERERFARLPEGVARRWAARRTLLRTVLATFLHVRPREVPLALDRSKPALLGDPLRFNLSHSERLALVAVAVGRDVGIDVERVREVPAGPHIVRRYFSDQERLELEDLAPARRTSGFIACWTRKEAYLKALGVGLTGDAMARATVSVDPDGPAELRTPHPTDARRWTLSDLDPAPGFRAAVAGEGQDWTLERSSLVVHQG